MQLSLPTDSNVRKTFPLFNGLFGYFGAALAEVAHHSWKSNEKHNPGQPLHWSMDKSNDHADCCARHLLDLGDMLGQLDADDIEGINQMLEEATAHAWRSLALLQTLLMQYRSAPMPFNAKRSLPEPEVAADDLTAWAEDMGAPAYYPAGEKPCECGKFLGLCDGGCIVVDSVQRPEQGGTSPAPWTPNCDTTAGPCRCGAWH